MTNQIATFDSSKSEDKKSAGWLTTNHITGEKSRVLLIPILYKKRYAEVFHEKVKGYHDWRSAVQRITVRFTDLPAANPLKDTPEKQKKRLLICTKKIFIKCSKMQHINHLVGKSGIKAHSSRKFSYLGLL